MVTTRRDGAVNEITRNEAKSRLGLLERTEPVSFNEVSEPVSETNETRNADMSRNFDMLLNYEKYIEEAKQKELEEQRIRELAAAAQETARVQTAEREDVNMEDITPTSTTMQFGAEDVGNLYSDMKEEQKETTRFRMNAHGKLLLAVYTIVVATILALIIINTSVLSSLKSGNAAGAERLEALRGSYEQVAEELDRVSSDEHVIDVATGEYNMVK